MISVIVPVYRAENCIAYCVDSLLAQTYTDIEIILVDDGSPDNSGAVCDELATKDSRVVVVHKENGGVSSARNLGISVAKGEYILFVDSDDYVEPDYVGAMVEQLADSEELQVWCGMQTVEGYNKESPKPNFTSGEAIMYFTRRNIMTLHSMWMDAGPCNKLFKTSVIRDNDLRFDETVSLGEDTIFAWTYIDLMGDARICLVTKPLYNYVRVGGDSLDSKYRPDMLEIYRNLNCKCAEFLLKWGISDIEMVKFYNSCYFSYDKVMKNTLRAPDMSFCAKLRQNSRLIKSDEFKTAFSKTDCYVNPLYRLGYKLNSYFVIWLTDKLHELKNR